MHVGQVKVVLDKLGIFTNKYASAPLYISRQKEIEGLLENDIFKLLTPKYVVTPEEILSSTQILNSGFYNNIKNPCIDKAYKRSCPIIYAYNGKKKNITLRHLSQIPGVTKIPGFIQISRVRQIPGVTQIPGIIQISGVSQSLWDIIQAYV